MFHLSPIYSAYKSLNHNYPKTTKSVLTQTLINKKYTNIKHNIFEELVPSVLPLLKANKQTNKQTKNKKNKKTKKQVRLGYAGIVDHSVDLSIPDF